MPYVWNTRWFHFIKVSANVAAIYFTERGNIWREIISSWAHLRVKPNETNGYKKLQTHNPVVKVYWLCLPRVWDFKRSMWKMILNCTVWYIFWKRCKHRVTAKKSPYKILLLIPNVSITQLLLFWIVFCFLFFYSIQYRWCITSRWYSLSNVKL